MSNYGKKRDESELVAWDDAIHSTHILYKMKDFEGESRPKSWFIPCENYSLKE